MDEVENLKKEVERLEPVDRRWLVIGAALAVAVVLFTLLIGSVVGDVIAFLVVLAAGWVVHTQWLAIASYRKRSRASGTAAPKRRSRSSRRSGSKS